MEDLVSDLKQLMMRRQLTSAPVRQGHDESNLNHQVSDVRCLFLSLMNLQQAVLRSEFRERDLMRCIMDLSSLPIASQA
jgi:hypothetical protein